MLTKKINTPTIAEQDKLIVKGVYVSKIRSTLKSNWVIKLMNEIFTTEFSPWESSMRSFIPATEKKTLLNANFYEGT